MRKREEGNYQEETRLLRIEIRNSIFCSSEEMFRRIDAISFDSILYKDSSGLIRC